VQQQLKRIRIEALAVAIGLAAAGGTGVALAWAQGSPTPDSKGRYLPDLVTILPGSLEVHKHKSSGGTRTLIAFYSAANNAGAGPLIIKGSRPSTAFATMSATQVIKRADGRTDRVPNVGTIRYIAGGGHSHWHLSGFMRYELRTPGGVSLGRRDHKQGFCLGDRYKADSARPGQPGSPVFTSECGRHRPGLLSIKEGISVGWGDGYNPNLEGQSIDMTSAPTGRYTLVLRVNPDHRMLDLHPDNDVSSLLFQYVAGKHPHAKILRWCTSTDRCNKR
jgi:Lysyl oxidase